MSSFLMNSSWLLNVLEKHVWHGFVVGTIALALVYTACKLFPKLPPDTASWLYRLGYLKLIVAFVFLKAISLTLPFQTPAIPTPAVHTIMQMSRHTSDLAASAARSAANTDAVPYLTILWELGMVLMGIRIARASYKTRVLRNSCSPIEDEELHRALGDLCDRMRIRKLPRLLQGSVSGPMICGFLSPSIILPDGFSREGIHLVLAHELAHVKRRDVMWAWLPMLAQWFFYFNPLVWLLHKEWLFSQEAACDAMAVEVTNASYAEYGRMLLDHVVPIPESRRLVSIGISEPYNSLKRRLKAMSSSQRVSSRKTTLLGTALLIIGIFASAFAMEGAPTLPEWAPKSPSPEFIRAAKYLSPLPPENAGYHASGPLDAAAWELFGTLTDEQIKDFMTVKQDKCETKALSESTVSFLKERCGGYEDGEYVITKKRDIRIPIKSLTEPQRQALDRYVRLNREIERQHLQDAIDRQSKLPEAEQKKIDESHYQDVLVLLLKNGAKEDLSDVSVVFETLGEHEGTFSLAMEPFPGPKPGTFTAISATNGSFAYIE